MSESFCLCFVVESERFISALFWGLEEEGCMTIHCKISKAPGKWDLMLGLFNNEKGSIQDQQLVCFELEDLVGLGVFKVSVAILVVKRLRCIPPVDQKFCFEGEIVKLSGNYNGKPVQGTQPLLIKGEFSTVSRTGMVEIDAHFVEPLSHLEAHAGIVGSEATKRS